MDSEKTAPAAQVDGVVRRPCEYDTNGDGDCHRCHRVGCEAYHNFREMYKLLDQIRSNAGRCYQIASTRLEQRQADSCDLLQRLANDMIGHVLRQIHED